MRIAFYPVLTDKEESVGVEKRETDTRELARAFDSLLTGAVHLVAVLYRFAHDLAQSGFKSSRKQYLIACFLVTTKTAFAVLFVPRRGLEPPRLAACAPEAHVATNYTTWAVSEIVAYKIRNTKHHHHIIMFFFKQTCSGYGGGTSQC